MSNPDFAGPWQDPGAQARPDYRGPAAGAASGQPWSQDHPSHRQGRRGTRARGRGNPDVPTQRSGRSSGAHAQPGYGPGGYRSGGYDDAGYDAGAYPPAPRSGGQGGWDQGYGFMLMEIVGDDLTFQTISDKGETIDTGSVHRVGKTEPTPDRSSQPVQQGPTPPKQPAK